MKSYVGHKPRSGPAPPPSRKESVQRSWKQLTIPDIIVSYVKEHQIICYSWLPGMVPIPLHVNKEVLKYLKTIEIPTPKPYLHCISIPCTMCHHKISTDMPLIIIVCDSFVLVRTFRAVNASKSFKKWAQWAFILFYLTIQGHQASVFRKHDFHVLVFCNHTYL